MAQLTWGIANGIAQSTGNYEIRYKATANYLASGATTATVKVGGDIPSNARYQVKYVPLSVLPTELKGTYTTLASLERDMLNKLKSKYAVSPTGYVFYDIVVQYSIDSGKNWYDVPAKLFPSKGVEITLPYPSGTSSSSTFKFYSDHMFTYAVGEKKVGELEYPLVNPSASGLRLTVTGDSPLLLAYTGGTNTSPKPTSGTGTAVSTGDTNNPVLWAALFGVSVVSLGAMVALPKLKKKKQEKNS